jgi:hypothetical protein
MRSNATKFAFLRTRIDFHKLFKRMEHNLVNIDEPNESPAIFRQVLNVTTLIFYIGA